MQEIWKDIPGYEGLYQASSYGKIRSLDRTITFLNKNGSKCTVKYYGKEIKQTLSNTGYYRVPLNNCGKKKICLVHRLVASSFLKNDKNLPQVNHIDGNRKNNYLNNLEWVTMSQNVRHAYNSGLNYGLRDELSPHKRAVIQLSKDGNFIKKWCSATQAARALGCHRQGIYQVCIHKKKTCLGYVWKYEDE